MISASCSLKGWYSSKISCAVLPAFTPVLMMGVSLLSYLYATRERRAVLKRLCQIRLNFPKTSNNFFRLEWFWPGSFPTVFQRHRWRKQMACGNGIATHLGMPKRHNFGFQHVCITSCVASNYTRSFFSPRRQKHVVSHMVV